MKRLVVVCILALGVALAQPNGSWIGTLQDNLGKPVAGAVIELRGPVTLESRTAGNGAFKFAGVAPGLYSISVRNGESTVSVPGPVAIDAGVNRTGVLRLRSDGGVALAPAEAAGEATAGEQLTSRQVSALPLNKRDFSQLLLLAAGTRTDNNGAANFTAQFTVNGQRGAATVFTLDGFDTTDPEMGGATFSNFNVDAIQEVNASAGVMPATIGHGAAGFTEIVTKSGNNDLHGSVFEFVRNAAFDARNFFDRQSVAQPGRIPPFNRHEFGFSNGGPIRRNRTFYFVEYQGFRQVLGTTQVLAVPAAAERQGRDTTAYPGDVLIVPVNPAIQPILSQYPLPNDPGGPYGERTYAISSKVRTVTDQFSVRIDHQLSAKSRIYGRFSLNNVDGPLTNPNQTAIDPSFAIPFFDHQRNAGIRFERTASLNFTSQTSIGYIRSTPNFPTVNRTSPAIVFSDGLYEGFNTGAGMIVGSYGNLYQLSQNFTWTRGAHNWRFGGEIRVNRDTTVFGTAPNGSYTFGGGAAYSPIEIRSQSGLHDLHPGDLLPDSLTGFLTATPFSYTITAAPDLFAQGERMGIAAVRRQSYNLYIQDSWKVSPKLAIHYGLRYELNSPITEGRLRSSAAIFEDTAGRAVDAELAARARFVVNVQPTYAMDYTGWGPRLALDWRPQERTLFRAGGSITTQLPNIWQDNLVTGGLPYTAAPLLTAAPGSPVPFQSSVRRITLPSIYTASGQPMYPTGNSVDVAPNTEMDVMRFERDLAALSGDQHPRPVAVQAMDPHFRNGYIGTWTAGVERRVGDWSAAADYVGTTGVKLARIDSPNGYSGAGPAFAPFTVFNPAGQPVGGFGPILVMTNRSHSTYHSLQTGLQKNSLRRGLGLQASYTFSKSLDDASSVLGGFFGGASGTVLQTSPQDPRDLRNEKGLSTFDVAHAFSLSAIQQFSLPGAGPDRLRTGWQLLAIAAVNSGSPFTVYSGIQQTGYGSNGGDRPDQVGNPELSTSRNVREDYFGLGDRNPSYFSIPIGTPGGTGPNRGRAGTLGRDTFRGPAFHNLDLSLIKDTAVGPSSNRERAILEIRAEVFNVSNTVNFGLPSNIVLGPGFGVISRTAGPSRQIQLSLKLLY